MFSINYTVIGVSLPFFFYLLSSPPSSTLFPYTTLFRSRRAPARRATRSSRRQRGRALHPAGRRPHERAGTLPRSEEHTSELQSRRDLVCRLLLEKKKQQATL